MTTYKKSNGDKIKKSVIDSRVSKAKEYVIESILDEYGYLFCEECKRSSGTYLDCAHTISVDECQKSARSELAYDPENIRLLCRECHQKQDKLL